MNIRVENSNLPEITKANKVETKGTASAKAQEEQAAQAEKAAARTQGVQQTMVDAPHRAGDSQIGKIQQDAENAKAQHTQRQIEMVSNTISGKDCQQMDGEGFSVNGTDVETIVTVVDKIKAELAKAGVDISVFGDELSGEQLEKLVGSTGYAKQLESAIREADLPLTEENISGCEEAIRQAASLTGCSEEAIKYLLGQELPPTVENLYKAQHSSSAPSPQAATGSSSVPYAAAQPAGGYYGSHMPQQAGQNAAGTAMDGQLKAQVEQVISRAGLPVNEDSMAMAQWMMGEQIPLTEENLRYAMELKGMELPPDAGQLMGAMLGAIAEGNRPTDAILLEGYSYADRAKQAAETVAQATDADIWHVVEKGLPFTIENLQAAQKENQQGSQGQQGADPGRQASHSFSPEDMGFVTAKRQLEETRLMMTAQANYALLKQGFAIETKPLEEVVEQLKALEEEYYKSLLSQNGVEPTAGQAAVFAETMGKTHELAGTPAYLLGNTRTDIDTINGMHQAGMSQKAELERAGEAYEALRTAPRADLGDSMKKAFRNVDDILEDLDLEVTEPNRRAVRILAYNRMEINPESISGIKAADQKVQNMFQNLSPSVVLEMIREGVNPLEMTVEQLNSKAAEIKNSMEGAEEDKFSKFLWKLEQHQEITLEERDSYIGIYRLLNQIDKTDGAVVGALVNQGAELTMKNLLTAVRTNRNSGIDVSVDETFGGTESAPTEELSISQQIESAYQTDCAKEAFGMVTPEGLQQAMANGTGKTNRQAAGSQQNMANSAGKPWAELTPEELLWQLKQAPKDAETEEAYYREQMQEFAGAKEAEAQVLQMLTSHDMPVTAYNILAAKQMMEQRNVFKNLFDPKNLGKEVDFEEVKAGILEEFGEAVKTPEDMAKAQKKLAEVAENVMKTMIQSKDVRSLDIRDMKIVKQQIALGTQMAKEEHYAIPVLVADELTNVQLKIVRGKEERGRVDIMFDSPALGKVAASFQIQPESVKGYIISDSPRTIEELKNREAELQERISPDAGDAWKVDMICSDNLELSRFTFGEKEAGQPEQQKEPSPVQTRALYGAAKAFLEEIKRAGQA